MAAERGSESDRARDTDGIVAAMRARADDMEQHPEDDYTLMINGRLCMIRRNTRDGLKHWCGYIIDIEEGEEDRVLKPHGGWTFMRDTKLGFDCAHTDLGDYIESYISFSDEIPVFRTFEFVKDELERVTKEIRRELEPSTSA